MIQLLSKVYFSAIINKSVSALAVVNDNSNTSSNLNYIIGGLIIIIIILLGSTIFSKRKLMLKK